MAYYKTSYIITVKEQFNRPRYPNDIQIPPISVCHTVNFNKTYVRENLVIPWKTLEKAVNMGISHDLLINEFLRYMNLFSIFVDVGKFDPTIWALMNEIYQATFRSTDFADFVADAIPRGKEIFKNCQWDGVQYPCHLVALPVDIPACYYLFVSI